MPQTVETLLLRNLHEVFGERDPVRRRAAIDSIFTADCVFSDPRGRVVGRDALDAAVAALQADLPGYAFAEIGAVDTLHDSGRLAWAFGPPDDPRRVTGLDVVFVRDGLIGSLTTFIDKPAG